MKGQDVKSVDTRRVTFALAFYFFVSISIVFLNRNLFNNTFKYPVFISWFQQICGFAVFNFILLFKKFLPASMNFTFDAATAVKILPLNIAFVGMIGFSNLCLKHVQVSTYQVARSLTLLFNLIFSTYWLKMKISLASWACCGIVIFGFIVCSLDSATLSFLGVITGVSSSLFQATYTVMIKTSLRHVDNDENKLLYYNLGISSMLFVPLIFLAGEKNVLSDLPVQPYDFQTWRIWSLLLLSALLGTGVNLATYLCVRVTSPVTFNVAGYGKACMQSLGGILFNGDIVTVESAFGIICTLFGSALYSKVKYSESKQMTSGIDDSKDSEAIQLKLRSPHRGRSQSAKDTDSKSSNSSPGSPKP